MHEESTVLIIPKKDGRITKLLLSRRRVMGLTLAAALLVCAIVFLTYDYLQIRREADELGRLRLQAREQKAQVGALLAKIDHLSLKMEELAQFDKKIRIVANLQKGSEREQLLGIGGPVNGAEKLRESLLADDRSLLEDAREEVDRLTAEAETQKDSFSELLAYLREQRSLVASTPSLWPVRGWVTSEFGRRASPFGKGKEFHRGIDIATRNKARILAPADGMVVEVGYMPDMGNMVRIDHGHGMTTAYGHLSRTAVKAGAAVRRGSVIGYVGNSGRSTGTHLHYAILLNGVYVNPRRYLN